MSWQLTVRWAGRCCPGYGGCYPSVVSCACYGSHCKISKLSILDSISKYRKYLAFSYSWTELQGQINNNTSRPWKNSDKNKFKLAWRPKWTWASFTSQTFSCQNLTQDKAFEQSKYSISKPVDFTVNDDDDERKITTNMVAKINRKLFQVVESH